MTTLSRADTPGDWGDNRGGGPAVGAGDGAGTFSGVRAAEFAILFFALPGLLALKIVDIPLWAMIWSATAVCLFLLLRDRTFDRAQLWNAGAVPGAMAGVLGLCALASLALGWIVHEFRPEIFLNFPRQKPVIWAIVMLAYPLLSVYPQNIVYRAFIFHRYRGVFTSPWSMVWASTAAFSWAHIIFHNWIALGLTAVGGLIFARTYQKTRSTLAVSIEHALYGCVVFTLGLGWYIYAGSVGR